MGEFTTIVRLAGINPYVRVPPKIVQDLGGGTRAPVLVRVKGRQEKPSRSPPRRNRSSDYPRLRAIARLGAGGWFRTTLVPSRSEGARLYLDTWMRDRAGVGVGDRVLVRLKLDQAERALPVPAALGMALRAHPKANAAWAALAPSRRREILTYLNFLKMPAALERNVQKVIASLLTRP